MSNGPETMSTVWTDGRHSRNFMNTDDGPDLCLGLLPQMPTAYFFSASLLVPVKIDGCLFFVTAFGIVCLDSLPFYRNDVTRSARAHEYAKCRTNRQKSRPNQRHCRRFARHCCRFVQPWQKYWFLSESKVASEFDFVASVCTGLNSTQIEGN